MLVTLTACHAVVGCKFLKAKLWMDLVHGRTCESSKSSDKVEYKSFGRTYKLVGKSKRCSVAVWK